MLPWWYLHGSRGTVASRAATCKLRCQVSEVAVLLTAAAFCLLLNLGSAALLEEATTGVGLLQQTVHHPLRVLLIGLTLAFASYAPVVK